MAFNTQKLDKGWELHCVVLEKRTGYSEKTKEDWYAVKAGGFTFFSKDLYDEVQEGQRVVVRGSYSGDRYSKATGGYSPQHDIEGVVVVEGAFVDSPTRIPTIHGNGVSKGQPA